MRKFSTLAFILVLSITGFAQQWLSPGACWVHRYGDLCGFIDHHRYVGDSSALGINFQVVEWTRTATYPGAPTSSIQRTFYTMQGNVVLTRSLFPQIDASWDTLYVLGVPGDRWWPRFTDQSCPPRGMLEIQDTGHVVIDGVSLRKWDLAYLDENGIPIPQQPWWADTIGIIDHIGSMPGYAPIPCNVQIWDICSVYRLHYSDAQIAFPDGTACEITTSVRTKDPRHIAITLHPNPGTHQLMLSGLSSDASRIEVRDLLGHLVHTQRMNVSNATIATSSWSNGTYFISVFGEDGPQVIKWLKQ